MPATPRLLTADELLNAPGPAEKVVDVPEWGGSVRLVGLSIDQVLSLRSQGGGDAAELSLLMLVESMVEPKLTRDQVVALRQKGAAPVMRLLNEAAELSGMTEGAPEAAARSFPA